VEQSVGVSRFNDAYTPMRVGARGHLPEKFDRNTSKSANKHLAPFLLCICG